MMRLFIDSNIFLYFYDFTGEDLIELNKLVPLIEDKKIDLLLPQQVKDETLRRREEIINKSLKDFKQIKLSLQFPSYCKTYKQYSRMRDMLKELKDSHKEMIEDLQQDIENYRLSADLLLEKLFGLATKIDRTQMIIDSARQRVDLDNPPGKKESIGDAVIWENLLAEIPNGDNLYMVSYDSDYHSPLDDKKLKEFLQQEWDAKKQSELHFYKKLSEFFKENFPEINLELIRIEKQKDDLVQSLLESPNYATTHALIAKLSEYNEFTQKQLEEKWTPKNRQRLKCVSLM